LGFELKAYDSCDGELMPNYLKLLKRIRKICKIFRENPRENDGFLQVEAKKDLKKELKLILDCMTCWYSLADTIKRVLRLQRQLKCALLAM